MKTDHHSRRRFITTTSYGLMGLSLPNWPNSETTHRQPPQTIQDIIDLIIKEVPGGEHENTVDTVKAGDPLQPCTGVVTTFLATAEAIQKAADLGANFVITHEPTFYNHLDKVDWLHNDPVYQFKKELINRHKMTIWRFHDYWHTIRPDGILKGLIDTLEWHNYWVDNEDIICEIPNISLKELAIFFKRKLNLKRPFIVGDPEMSCTRVALLPGAWGGQNQINQFTTGSFDVMVVGEVAEWETSEYIRDANFAGMNKGLIILGHADSEEPGMKYLVDWLELKIKPVPIYHIPSGDAFQPV